MARKKVKSVVKTRAPRAAKTVSQYIKYAGHSFTTQHGLVVLGQGSIDGRMYGLNTATPQRWELMESVPMTQEQSIALQLKAHQAAEQKNVATEAAQPRPKRSLKIANGASTDEAFE